MDSNVLAAAIQTILRNRLAVHSLFIERNGRALLDAYFFPFADDEPHNLASVTKSVTSTLVGIAQENGAIAVDQPLSRILPEETDALHDPRKSALTLGALLSMTSGLDCSAAAGENLILEMEQSSDWVNFVLNRPLVAAPGTRFQYCGGNMHLVSAALTRATGRSALELARQEIFSPLGINSAVWPSDPRGNSRGFADLELQPRDAAKLGYLWLHDGTWEGRALVPAAYLSDALAPHARVQPGIAYGYGFWLYPSRQTPDFEANGRGGQRITIVPSQNLVTVITGGGIDANVVAGLIAPALRSNTPLAPDPAGAQRLAAAVAEAAKPPPPHRCPPLPRWVAAIEGREFVLDENPLRLRTLDLWFASPCVASVRLGYADGASGAVAVGLDGVPRLSPDPLTHRTIGLSGSWRGGGLDLEENEISQIDDYRLAILPVDGGLRIHLTERTGLVDLALFGRPD